MMPTEPPYALTAGMLADFDQAWARSSELFAKLCAIYVESRRSDRSNDVPEPLTIVGMSIWLSQNLLPDVTASALAVAIVSWSEAALDEPDG